MNAKKRFCRMLRIVPWLSRRARTIPRRSPFTCDRRACRSAAPWARLTVRIYHRAQPFELSLFLLVPDFRQDLVDGLDHPDALADRAPVHPASELHELVSHAGRPPVNPSALQSHQPLCPFTSAPLLVGMARHWRI